ncbi:MAG: gamma-glutamyl-gamma-aminobutyrate hydrolase family protein [Proteobacteria bacterium]|nr:gamma-glutamyl-gamma-aminobutyrate hydrolase family protein [Pseudomonadota bacterium]
MALIIVEHNQSPPALYGAAAAIVARARGAAAMHLPARFDPAALEACQHVTGEGALVASGLIWFDRAGVPLSAATTPDEIVKRARDGDVVVPISGALTDRRDAEALLQAAAESGEPAEHLIVEAADDDTFRLIDAATGKPAPFPVLVRDGYGRLAPSEPRFAHRAASAPVVRILVVGNPADHLDINPATLAALGDAADLLDIRLAVSFAPPAEVLAGHAARLAAFADGIVLPGGANMANVPAQIAIAEEAWRSSTPVVGLCLGMQTMTTAVIRGASGRNDINLAEVDPDAALHTFVPLMGTVPDRHKLGECPVVTMTGSRLNAVIGALSTIRSNHRFKLNPQLIEIAEAAGLAVTARDPDGAIAEGVELGGHPFFMGMQGHPELKSRKGAPHPLLKAFVEAASKHA